MISESLNLTIVTALAGLAIITLGISSARRSTVLAGVVVILAAACQALFMVYGQELISLAAQALLLLSTVLSIYRPRRDCADSALASQSANAPSGFRQR